MDNERQKAKAKILEIHEQVQAAPVDFSYKQTQIDWGTSKGQGKRSGGMVKGGMGFGTSGIVSYSFVDLTEYKDELAKDGHHKMIEGAQIEYIRARQFGLTHIESVMYAVLWRMGKLPATS